MKSTFAFDATINTTIPDFMDASAPLDQLGAAIVNDIQKHIRQGISPVTEKPFHPLERSTKEKKRTPKVARTLMFGPDTALVRKGIMYRAIHAYKTSNNTLNIGVIPRKGLYGDSTPRDQVASFQQFEGVGPARTTREFMGLSPMMIAQINTRMRRWIESRIKNATKKYLKIKT